MFPSFHLAKYINISYERCILSQCQITFKVSFQNFNVAVQYSAQYCLMSMTEKWKKPVDKGKTFAALLTNLSKGFDCLPQEFIIAKPNAYEFSF